LSSLIDLKIDKAYLVYKALATDIAPDGLHTFIAGQTPRDHLKALAAAAEKIDPLACKFIRAKGHIFDIMALANHLQCDTAPLAARAEKLIEQLMDNAAFLPVLQDTQKALADLAAEWDANFQKSLGIISDLTGLSFGKSFPVYITHPCQAAGHNNYGKIFCTYRNDFPNYNTVYMWHEILHSYITFEDKGDYAAAERAPHAVIQLVADNELRVRLNGGNYPPFEGHPYLNSTVDVLLPSWRAYLAQKEKRDILKYLQLAVSLEKERVVREDKK
jgi:hypothetical protein